MKDGNETPGMEEGINTTFVTIGCTTVLRPLAIAGEKSPAKRVCNEKLKRQLIQSATKASAGSAQKSVAVCLIYIFLPPFHSTTTSETLPVHHTVCTQHQTNGTPRGKDCIVAWLFSASRCTFLCSHILDSFNIKFTGLLYAHPTCLCGALKMNHHLWFMADACFRVSSKEVRMVGFTLLLSLPPLGVSSSYCLGLFLYTVA